MSARVTIIGCGIGREDLTERHHAAIGQADILAGGARLLAWFPEFKGQRVALAAHALDTLTSVVERGQGKRIVVLASGDALFFGIGSSWVRQWGAAGVEILPNITAAQAALARLGLSWDQARFFSAHGRDQLLPWRSVLQARVAVVYAEPGRTAAAVAAELIRQWPAAETTPGAICENLGEAGERCVRGPLRQLAALEVGGLSVLVVEGAAAEAEGVRPPLPLGLADETYQREGGLITQPEVRAVALAKLRLRPGLLWDIGAGSGSVGIEAAGLCDGLTVYAVEAKADRCALMLRNARDAGVARWQLVQGVAPEALDGLPPPHSVFVGGGGQDVNSIVEAAFDRLVPGGTLVASAVMLETRARLLECLPAQRVELLEIEIKRACPLGPGHRYEPEHPVALFVFRKTR